MHSMFRIHYSPMSKSGFTLIELLLYSAILVVIFPSLVLFLFLAQESRIKHQAIAEVEGQGAHVMQIITQTARNAEHITSPTQGTTSSSLVLDVLSAGSDPTVFDVSSGVIRITEGVGSPVALTNARVTGSGLSIQNLSLSGTPGTVRIQFTLTHQSGDGGSEFSYAKTFIGSASLRYP